MDLLLCAHQHELAALAVHQEDKIITIEMHI